VPSIVILNVNGVASVLQELYRHSRFTLVVGVRLQPGLESEAFCQALATADGNTQTIRHELCGRSVSLAYQSGLIGRLVEYHFR